MNAEKIEKELYGIFEKFIPEDGLKRLWEQNKDLPLTGMEWNFDAINMTYLLLEVEKAFAVRIPTTYLEKYQFNTLNGITGIIRKLLD